MFILPHKLSTYKDLWFRKLVQHTTCIGVDTAIHNSKKLKEQLLISLTTLEKNVLYRAKHLFSTNLEKWKQIYLMKETL